VADTSSYPLPAYSFRVTIGGATLSFAEVSGIERRRETATYRHGLSYAEGEDITSFDFDAFIPVTFKRGIARGRSELRAWLDTRELRPVDVSLVDATGAAVVTWHIAKAIATKLSAPALDAGSNEVAIESLEVMARAISLEHL
jgi:phage tail-like protein